MWRRSLREHPRLWLMVLAPTFLLVETACNGTPASNSGQVQISVKEAKKFLDNGDKTVKAYRGGVQVDPGAAVKGGFAAAVNSSSYVYGNYTGKVNLTPPKHIHGLSGLTNGTFKAGAKLGYISNSSDNAKGTGTVLVRFAAHGAGSVCVRLSWTTDATQQKITGKFDFLGGTGRAARLHDRGKLLGVQPTPFVAKGQLALFGTPSIGKTRRVPKGCGSIKPPPPPKNVNASIAFNGFAASVGQPAPAATLYPSTVSDPTLCQAGGGLYAVFAYTGPASATTLQLGIFDNSSTGVTVNLTPKPGLNDVLMARNPKNGSYSFKGQLLSKSGGTVSGNSVVYAAATVAAGC